ncbi:MAG TPA: hypothetical protein VFU13_11430 [Steroidobacteraceae bacterium]|nr:hypothetical protein [Steroidobacteraceae bacterium]
MNTFKRLALAALAAPLFVIAPAHAGGPLANCSDGVPFLWANGGQGIVWNADQGGLGELTKAQADELVGDSFGQWQDVASSTISFAQGANLPVDVDETNFLTYFDAAAPDGLSAIVYDDTGEIFELLFGVDSGVLGFAGPEFGDPAACTILEGLAFLNGPEFTPADLNAGFAIMVHEFGHFSNLSHTQTNGGILLGIAVGTPETSGPAPFNTFGTPTVADFVNNGLLETMYPFFFGSEFGEETPALDDVMSVSRLYPEPGYFATTASVAGNILGPNGTTRLSGVNVIARNVANPFLDAVSALSGDFTDAVDPTVSAVVGTYRFTGLTPGAQYAVFVDEILEGGFSTPPRLLPGPEEFHSGAAESNNDAPGTFTAVMAAAGATSAGVNVIFNVPQPGQPLPVGDDGFVELFPPFPIDFCGQRFTSLFVNGNGNVTFGRSDGAFSETTLAHLNGPPRIAALWDDLNAGAAGTVTFDQSADSFVVRWDGVPEFPSVGSNTFSITINRKNLLGDVLGAAGNPFSIAYGTLSAADGLAGYSCGSVQTSGFEQESDFSFSSGLIGSVIPVPAIFEEFVGTGATETVDLRGTLSFRGVNRIVDLTELVRRNDSIANATPLPRLPFDSANPAFATVIDADRDDVDFYSFRVSAGDVLAVEVVRGGVDSVIGIFDADTGELLVTDDDGGNGLLSRLVVQADADQRLAVAVSTFPDLTFVGTGESAGRYSLYINKYRGTPITIGDDATVPVTLTRPFSFQGQSHSSVFVNSNGSLSFGAGDTSFSASVPAFLAGPPRISALWTDLDPTGSLGNPGVVLVDTEARPAAVHFVSVSQFFSSNPNYFTAELQDRGGVAIKWGPTARGAALVGTTPGGGAADPGPTDLSKRGLRPAIGTVYENFQFNVTSRGVSNFDLFFDEVRNR